MTISVVVADDQPLMRSALAACLKEQPDITVVALAANGQQAVELVRRHRPDVVMMDVRMPGIDGVEATRAVVADPDGMTRVLVVTTFELDEYIVATLRAGASGFILKDATAEEIVQAVRTVAVGEAILAPTVTRRLLDRFAALLPLPMSAVEHTSLTPRERDVLRLVAHGRSNAEIATALFVGESSVKTHVGHLLAKLQVHDRVHLVIYAYEAGLVRPGAMPADQRISDHRG